MTYHMFLNPVLSLYDNDNPGDDGGDSDSNLASAAADAAAALASNANKAAQQNQSQDDPNAPVGGDPNARFSQDQVNKIVQDRLAKERKRQQDQYQKLESSYQELLGNQTLSDEERNRLQQQLEDIRKQHRTKEEQAKHEKRQLQEQYESRLKEFQEKAVYWESEYRTSTVNRSLMDAAVKNDAFMPQQVVTILREYTKLVQPVDENGKTKPGSALTPVVDLPDVDADTGKSIITQRTPEEAVARLKELQPNLFKANVVSGVGGNSTTGGVMPGADGRVDAQELSTEQFMKLYKEDPSKLGLRSRRRL